MMPLSDSAVAGAIPGGGKRRLRHSDRLRPFHTSNIPSLKELSYFDIAHSNTAIVLPVSNCLG